MITPVNVAWLAALLEGEGSFGYYNGCPTIQLAMTDRDVIERAANLLGVKPEKTWMRKDGYKPVSKCRAFGTDATGWMMTIYQFMGQRRRARIREVLAAWRESPRRPRAPRGRHSIAQCHPDREVSGHGLCHACYMHEWRANKRVNPSIFTLA